MNREEIKTYIIDEIERPITSLDVVEETGCSMKEAMFAMQELVHEGNLVISPNEPDSPESGKE